MKSTKLFEKRRSSILKHIGMNLASRFIPLMIKACESRSKHWDISNSYINMSEELTLITFDIICKIIFGDDLSTENKDTPYISSDGSSLQITMAEAFLRTCSDCVTAGTSLQNTLFPWTVKLCIGKENSRNSRNGHELIRVIKKFLRESKD